MHRPATIAKIAKAVTTITTKAIATTLALIIMPHHQRLIV